MALKDLPIRRKIIIVIMLTCLSALFIAGTMFFAFQIKNYRVELRQEMASIASLIGSNSQAAIEFEDRKAAEKILEGLRHDQRIYSSILRNANGESFAAYHRSKDGEEASDLLSIKHTITLNDKVIGYLNLEVDTMIGFNRRLWEFGAVALLTVAFAAIAAYFISRRLQRIVSLPIINLAETARKVSLDRDYNIRAEKGNNDEIGVLIDRFNEMLEEVRLEDSKREKAENELKILNEKLEQRVVERSEELKQSLEKLRHTERLASIGTLAAGMAHEIRNPINSISLAAQHALRYQKSLDAFQEKTLSTIANEATRCGTIVKNILLFAKSEKTIKTPQSFNDVIHKAVVLAKSYAKSTKVEIALDLDPTPGLVSINSTEMEQVVVNILNNAIEASAEDIKITIKTAGDPEKLEVTITDNGPGIPPDVLGQIFDPFFSTKRKQGNTGLGLSLCHGIISEHQGYMNVKSEVGKGTVFSIELPRALS